MDANPVEIKIEYFDTIKQLAQSSDIAVSLDELQFQLCKAIFKMKDNDQLMHDFKKIRLQIIIGINQLRTILGLLKGQPTDTQKKDLDEWVKFMSKLQNQSISLLKSGRNKDLEEDATGIAEIMEYQGISDAQVQEALKIL